MFLLAGLAELPFSVMGYFGEGGNDNSMSFSLYFVGLGTFLMLKPLVSRRAGVDALGLVSGNRSEPDVGHVGTRGPRPGTDSTEREPWRDSLAAERFIRAHPGEVYFPWNPESHLAAEGKSYPPRMGSTAGPIRESRPAPPTFSGTSRLAPGSFATPPQRLGAGPHSGRWTFAGFSGETAVAELPGAWGVL